MDFEVDDEFITTTKEKNNNNNDKANHTPKDRKPKREKPVQKSKLLAEAKKAIKISFDEEKTRCLESINDVEPDKSRAGKLDEAIIPLVDVINSKKDIYTTSSCSGRVIVVETPGNGYHVEWVFISHDIVEDCSSIIEAIERYNGPSGTELWFKMEPPIVAISCRDIESAQQLLDQARMSAGLKNCAIRGTRNDRVMVALVDTHRIETLIYKDGKLLVSREYMQIMVEAAAQKLRKSRQRMDVLKDAIQQNMQ